MIPNWAAAIIWDSSSIARRVVRATRDPSAAFGSTFVRRAETSANSEPTKNAFPSSRTRPSQIAPCVLMPCPRPDSVRYPTPGQPLDRQPVDSQTVHALDAEQRVFLHRLLVVVLGEHHGERNHHVVASRRDAAELADEQAGHRVVVLVLGQGQSGRVGDLVGAEEAGDDPGTVGSLSEPGAVAVVLVGDVPDDLLDDVFQRDHAGRSAVLVGDDRHLEPLTAQQGEKRVESQ